MMAPEDPPPAIMFTLFLVLHLVLSRRRRRFSLFNEDE